MAAFHHLYTHIKEYGIKHKTLYMIAVMVFFWSIFDGIISFLTPTAISQAGISESIMGLIMGFSSVAGMLFDFLLCRMLKNTNYRRMYMFMFAICLIHPLILWKSKSIVMFLIAMAVWGLYYDLFNLGNFDFVGRKMKKKEHASSFGVLGVFSCMGYLLAPLLAALLIGEILDIKPFIMSWVFIVIALLLFLIMIFMTRKNKDDDSSNVQKQASLLKEIRLWKKISKIILPVLILTIFLNIINSFFWTLGPIIAENMSVSEKFSGFFLMAYELPPLLVGWFIGRVTVKAGKKKTAFITLLLASITFCTFFLIQNPVVLVLVNFVASFFLAMTWPAVSGAYADYISEAPKVEKEIETVQDSFTNLGFIIGPMIAGLLGQFLGYTKAFSILGFCGVILALVLLKITPKHINIPNKA